MELLNFSTSAGVHYGQRFGFINYRVEVPEIKTSYEVTGNIRDYALLLVDHTTVSTVDSPNNFHYNFTSPLVSGTTAHKLDFLIENSGRPNGGDAHARKGILNGEIRVDGKAVNHIRAYSLDFNATYVAKLSALTKEWVKYDHAHPPAGPALYRASLTIEGEPQDTYLALPDWTKGVVFVNDFNIGRYWSVGPQKTLYIPGPVLKKGVNSFVVFELHKSGLELVFQDYPVLE